MAKQIKLVTPEQKYFAGDNANFSDKKAEAYGREIEKIQAEMGGPVTTDRVIEEASKKRSPLHSHFQWDDAIAAHAHRRLQARQLLRVITVEVDVGGNAVRVPAFTSVQVDVETAEGEEPTIMRVYMSEDSVRNSEHLHHQRLYDAVERLKYWRKQFYKLKELAPVFAAIEALEADMKKSLRRKAS